MNTITESRQTVPVPLVSRIAELSQEISVLRSMQADLLKNALDDCTFMDVPILRLLRFEIDSDNHVPGDLCHVVFIEHERDGSARYNAHRAADCTDWMCELTGRTKFPKYAHVGNRSWATPQTDHVLLSIETFIDRAMNRYILAPVSQPAGPKANN